MPVFVSGVDEGGALGDAGVVNKDIGVTKTFAQFAEHSLDALRIRNVTGERDGAVANLGCDLLDLFNRSGGDCDACSFACERERDRSSDASAAAGYQCCFAFEHVLVTSEPRFAFFEKCLDAFVTVVRIKTTQLSFSLVTKHLIQFRRLAHVDRVFCCS